MASNPKEKQVPDKSNTSTVPDKSNTSTGTVPDKSNTSTGNVRWTAIADATLVKSMLKLLEDDRWRAENGQLKSCAYGKLEKIMEELLPGCGMKARPHFESRVRLLRRQYYAIHEMRGPNCSGFGWNDQEKSISCDKIIFYDWLKIHGIRNLIIYSLPERKEFYPESHPNAKGLRNKSFPFYDELAQVFGKDRANGECVESPADAVEEIAIDEESNQHQQSEKEKENFGDEVSPTTNSQSTNSSSRGSKRLKTESMEIVKELTYGLQRISNVMENGNENIARLTSCFQHESDGAKKRMLVISEVMKVQGLTADQLVKVGRKIALDPLETDYFFSLPEEFRSTYVHSLLIPDF